MIIEMSDKIQLESEQFIDLLADPDSKGLVTASVKDIGFNENRVTLEASKLSKRGDISKAIEERKKIAAYNANITPEMILGATALRAFASIDDAFDSNGNFDIKKARKTGAIHLIKKLERTKYGWKVEFYSNEAAQDKLGNYLGMEYAPKENDQSLSLKAGIEEVARSIANGLEPTEEHKSIAFRQIRDWALKRGALYNQSTLAELAKEYDRT